LFFHLKPKNAASYCRQPLPVTPNRHSSQLVAMSQLLPTVIYYK
jgi:hypothetical protein